MLPSKKQATFGSMLRHVCGGEEGTGCVVDGEGRGGEGNIANMPLIR